MAVANCREFACVSEGREECHCCMCVTAWVGESVVGCQRAEKECHCCICGCQRGEKECHYMCVTVWVGESVVGGQRKSVTVVSVDVRGERRSVTVVCVSLCGLERVWFCGCICEREKRIILVKDCLGVFIY